jgi:ribosomal protein S15P/S13E
MTKKTSANKKAKYGAHKAKVLPNKIRKIMKHLKKQPNDQQSMKVLEKLQ